MHVPFEHGIQLIGGLGVEDESVCLVVIAQAAAVEIGSTHRAESAVYHHYLGMVEAAVEEIYLGSFLHQLVCYVE